MARFCAKMAVAVPLGDLARKLLDSNSRAKYDGNRMNPTLISVPSKSGAQGDSIENFVLDRVSGDVEKNMGLVIENALQGASVPVAFALVLSATEQLRRLYVVEAANVPGAMKDANAASRETAVTGGCDAYLFGGVDATDSVKMTLADPSSTLKSKAWDLAGLTQTATTSGSSGDSYIDSLFIPARKAYTLAALVAKLEDLALTNDHVVIYGNQNFPEIYVMKNNVDALAIAAMNDFLGTPVLAQVNGIFVAESGESNPNFGFESGGGF